MGMGTEVQMEMALGHLMNSSHAHIHPLLLLLRFPLHPQHLIAINLKKTTTTITANRARMRIRTISIPSI
jgi:hypothetical protein